MSRQTWTPSISVVIPLRNEALYIEACLAGVYDQSYPRELTDVIVVENFSDDGSYELASALVAPYPNDRVVRFQGSSIAAARNHGFELARGQIIAFLDGDSVPDPDWLESVVELFADRPETGCIGFAMKRPGARATWIERDWYDVTDGGRKKGTEAVRWVPSFNLAVRRERFEEVGGFDEALETGEDFDLGYRLSRHSEVIRSDRVFVDHLGTTGDIVSFFRKERWRGVGTVDLLAARATRAKAAARLTIPLLYLAALASLPVLAALTGLERAPGWFLAPSLAIAVGVPIVLALRSGVRRSPTVARVSFLYAVYLVARAFALFEALRGARSN